MASKSFISPFVRKTTADDSIEGVQNSLENSFRSVEACPLLDGHLLEQVKISQGDNEIAHKLGRELKGWILTRQDFATTIIDKQDDNNHSDKMLVLNSSASGTTFIDLWVF